MKILILTSEFKPYVWGGLGRYTNEVYNTIKDRCNVDVLNIPTYSNLFLEESISESDTIIETESGNKIVHFFRSDITSIFDSIHSQNNVSELIENIYSDVSVHFDKQYDIIFLQDYYNSLLALKFLLMNKTRKIISVIHLPLYSGFTYFDKPLSDEVHHYLESVMIRYSRKIIVPSKFAKRAIIQSHSINENSVVVNYHGSHFSEDSLVARPANKVLQILSVQRLTEQKGLMYLIRILKKLAESSIPFQWTIIGNGPKSDLFRKKITSEGLDKFVELLPFVNHDDIHKYYDSADVFISTTAFETFGFTIIESMSYACLSISFNNGSVNELIDNMENGFLFNTSEYDDIVDLIIDFNRNPEKYRLVKTNAITKAKSFCWEKNVERLLTLFEQESDE
ncbi:MAG: glycosyltransferase family 4 protein [Bacteroidetes bacterium]|nr:glycosyltransferase family 4 protein [Bacteroidota bacterium]